MPQLSVVQGILLDGGQGASDLLVSLRHRSLTQTGENAEEIFINQGRFLLDNFYPGGLIGSGHQPLQQCQALLLGIQHFLGDPIRFQDCFEHGLHGEHGPRPEQVGFTLFVRQAVHDLVDHRPNHPFLFVDRYAKVGWEKGQQQFFRRIMINQGGAEISYIAATAALDQVILTRKQVLFGFRIGTHVE